MKSLTLTIAHHSVANATVYLGSPFTQWYKHVYSSPSLVDSCPASVTFTGVVHLVVFPEANVLHASHICYSNPPPQWPGWIQLRAVFVYCVQQQSLFVAGCQSGQPVVMKDTWTFPSISHLLQSIIQQDSQLKMRESGQGLAPRRPPLDNSLRE